MHFKKNELKFLCQMVCTKLITNALIEAMQLMNVNVNYSVYKTPLLRAYLSVRLDRVDKDINFYLNLYFRFHILEQRNL